MRCARTTAADDYGAGGDETCRYQPHLALVDCRAGVRRIDVFYGSKAPRSGAVLLRERPS
jgi:hypothetical protein